MHAAPPVACGRFSYAIQWVSAALFCLSHIKKLIWEVFLTLLSVSECPADWFLRNPFLLSVALQELLQKTLLKSLTFESHSTFMPGWHGVLMRWLRVCWLMHCRFAPNQGRTILCCLCVAVFGSKLRCVTRSTRVCIIHGGVNCLNSLPYRCYTHV